MFTLSSFMSDWQFPFLGATKAIDGRTDIDHMDLTITNNFKDDPGYGWWLLDIKQNVTDPLIKYWVRDGAR